MELERQLAEALAPLAGHALVSEIRAGLGVVAAVQIDPSLLADDPALADRATAAARDHGVLTRTLVGGGLQISPPLVVTGGDLAELHDGLRAALDAVAA